MCHSLSGVWVWHETRAPPQRIGEVRSLEGQVAAGLPMEVWHPLWAVLRQSTPIRATAMRRQQTTMGPLPSPSPSRSKGAPPPPPSLSAPPRSLKTAQAHAQRQEKRVC